MAESDAFDFLSEFLEAETPLDRLESRGTVRLMLKKAGLTPRDTDSSQLALVVEKLLAEELAVRGVEMPSGVCDRVAGILRAMHQDARNNSPARVFDRMAAD